MCIQLSFLIDNLNQTLLNFQSTSCYTKTRLKLQLHITCWLFFYNCNTFTLGNYVTIFSFFFLKNFSTQEAWSSHSLSMIFSNLSFKKSPVLQNYLNHYANSKYLSVLSPFNKVTLIFNYCPSVMITCFYISRYYFTEARRNINSH